MPGKSRGFSRENISDISYISDIACIQCARRKGTVMGCLGAFGCGIIQIMYSFTPDKIASVLFVTDRDDQSPLSTIRPLVRSVHKSEEIGFPNAKSSNSRIWIT
jgi:hypothetical protein